MKMPNGLVRIGMVVGVVCVVLLGFTGPVRTQQHVYRTRFLGHRFTLRRLA